ncbi:hypothetical protein GON03_06770 [Nocardioides sp. MAH-18]|uniref:Uncharacterized protein n=1 Tax=Nocardioides agri TaxID=2682843 RepID=A0A6L6XP36_9ACTN|nr:MULTISPECIES: hypothetical protein [unclassified Nocardioides]MBA2954017.1 hypothetical protein [Nocardioides sp. CGMCC 1.13656]MVQ48880.1 hypothetical protein [Nocardioides sp. MAH-18]
MGYSVVGAPALGFDLARLPGGSQVAEVLRVAIAASPAEVERLADCHPGAGAREQWRQACADAAASTSSMRDALPLAGAAIDEAAAGETALLRRLETSLLGDADALDRFVRHDLLDWTWLASGPVAVQDPGAALAADVLVDAATSAYLREELPGELRRAMAAPYVRAALPDDGSTVTVGLPEVDARLASVAGSDHQTRSAWRRVVDELRVHTAQWAPAMHQATWALSLAERLRTACDAQLAGVIAFDRGGFTAHDAAYGVWNAWAGVVQASAVSDLLPAADAAVLLRPWRAVHPHLD